MPNGDVAPEEPATDRHPRQLSLKGASNLRVRFYRLSDWGGHLRRQLTDLTRVQDHPDEGVEDERHERQQPVGRSLAVGAHDDQAAPGATASRAARTPWTSGMWCSTATMDTRLKRRTGGWGKKACSTHCRQLSGCCRGEVCGGLVCFQADNVGEVLREASGKVARPAADVEGGGASGASDASCGEQDQRSVGVVVGPGALLVDAMEQAEQHEAILPQWPSEAPMPASSSMVPIADVRQHQPRLIGSTPAQPRLRPTAADPRQQGLSEAGCAPRRGAGRRAADGR